MGDDAVAVEAGRAKAAPSSARQAAAQRQTVVAQAVEEAAASGPPAAGRAGSDQLAGASSPAWAQLISTSASAPSLTLRGGLAPIYGDSIGAWAPVTGDRSSAKEQLGPGLRELARLSVSSTPVAHAHARARFACLPVALATQTFQAHASRCSPHGRRTACVVHP